MRSSPQRNRGACAVAVCTVAAALCACSSNGVHSALLEHDQPDSSVSPLRSADSAIAPDADVVFSAPDASPLALLRSGDVLGAGGSAAQDDASVALDAARPLTADELPYARHVDSFTPGANAGFGQARFPDIVLGPPKGGGTTAGSLDVLSLGVGGEIVLDFGTREIVDGPGPDFIVFENAFWPGGDPTQVFAEPGEVAVSDDLKIWHTFACDPKGDGRGHYPGCAGWTPVQKYDALQILPLDPAVTGGDAFDLASVSVLRARYLRIRDLSTSGAGTSAGFDLDAAGLVHYDQL